jgi:hypothetical protein
MSRERSKPGGGSDDMAKGGEGRSKDGNFTINKGSGRCGERTKNRTKMKKIVL